MELDARFDSRKSFYGKAHAERLFQCIFLYSYGSKVATFDENKKEITLMGLWNCSQTTMRHVREFVSQMFELGRATSTKEILQHAHTDGNVLKIAAF